MQAAFQKSEQRFCPLCGPNAGKKIKYPGDKSALDPSVFGSRDGVRGNSFPFAECIACGMIFADPAPTAEVLDSLYENSPVEYDALEPWVYRSYIPLVDRACTYVSDRDTFVDVGGGNGFLLHYGAEKKFQEQIEIETSKDGKKKFRSPSPAARFIGKPFSKDLLPKNSVSMMCVLHTLDHVPDPLQFLGDAFAAIKPKGVLLCAVHNTRAWSALILRHKSPIFNNSHTYLFNKKNIRALFEKANFAVMDVWSYANTYPLWYWVRSVKGMNAMQLGWAKNIPITFFAGNMAIVARKPANH